MFRLDEDDIDDLRDQTRDDEPIDAYSRWFHKSHLLDPLIDQLETSFAGVRLAHGTGLREGDGLDNNASDAELARLRSLDEDTDWRRIPIENLNRFYAAVSFMNPRGFIFHLPAFLAAELNDEFEYGFIDRLISPNPRPADWIDLLNHAQRNAIAAILRLIAMHPDFDRRLEDIKLAVDRLLKGEG